MDLHVRHERLFHNKNHSKLHEFASSDGLYYSLAVLMIHQKTKGINESWQVLVRASEQDQNNSGHISLEKILLAIIQAINSSPDLVHAPGTFFFSHLPTLSIHEYIYMQGGSKG